MAVKLKRLRITEIALCAQGRNPEADILLYKSARNKMDLASLPKEVQDYVAKLQSDLDQANSRALDLEKSLTAAKAAVPIVAQPVVVEKSVEIPVELQKHLDRQTAEIETLRKSLDTQACEKYVLLAKSELAAVPGIDSLAAKLYQLNKSDSALVDELRTVLKSLTERATVGETVLTSTIGVDVSGSASAKVMDRVTTMAKSLVANKEAPSLAHAITKVLTDNPALYDEYNAERE